MKKITCITGTRPQLIKHAVLSRALQENFHVESLYTGQHYNFELHELLKKDLLSELNFHNLKLDYNEAPAQRLGEMVLKTAAFLEASKPQAVLVYGDTDTTLAGALAATKMNLKLIHIEAGERSFNRDMPEEFNRIATDAAAHILFCASYTALENVQKEQHKGVVYYSGDLMKDLLMQKAELFQNPIIDAPYIFCTIHRNYTRQNVAKLEELLHVLATLNQIIVFPVHPATQPMIEKLKSNKGNFPNIRFLSPVSYSDSIRYQKFASAVITDSGGIQKEAYWLKRRCITVRKETEWVSTLNGNWNQLVYNDLSVIKKKLQTTLGTHDPELYGNGKAAACITENLVHLI